MSKFNYESYEKRTQAPKPQQERRKVGYFNALKDDGDEAVVRFPYKSVDDFDLENVHKVMVDDKRWRNIACLRNWNDPISDCPFCQNGTKLEHRFFIKLIEYKKDENNNIVANPVVWDRPFSPNNKKSEATQLKSFLDEYQTIKDNVFKIKRYGAKGSVQTYYDIILANPSVYKPELYPADFSVFDDLDLAHHSFMNKTKEEMQEYLDTGKFPKVEKKEDKKEEVVEDKPTYTPNLNKFENNTFDGFNTSNDEDFSKPRRIYKY